MPAPKGYWIPEAVALRAFTRWRRGAKGCRISSYSTASHGYAQVGWLAMETGRMTGTTAHRAAWVHVHGQIPTGMTVDHRSTCDRRCVNVKHLRLLTNFENGRRTFGRDWPVGQCINGHPNSELIVADGGRRIRCRICRRDYNRTYRQRRGVSTKNYRKARPIMTIQPRGR